MIWAAYELPGGATISATSYVGAPTPGRPVTFLFNGGPGASSSPLHLNAFGPRIFGPGRVLQTNPHSLLDRTDLVFIDPPGTGFSRAGDGRHFSVEADAAAGELLVRRWLADHGREGAPIYLTGQSYGGFRLATMCATSTDLPVAGLILISPMLDASASATAPGNDLPHVFNLPSMAVAAWHHGRAQPHAPDAGTVFRAARAFAQDDYVRALQHGGEQTEVARQVAEMIGVDAGTRPDSERFLRELLGDVLIGRLDTRVTGPMPPPAPDDRPPAADDPALGLGRSNARSAPEIAEYLRSGAGATATGPYTSVDIGIALRFDFRAADKRLFYHNPTENIGRLPSARVLLIGGYFDLATPLLGGIYALAHAGLPLDRVDVLPLPCGHSIDREALPAAAAAVRAFIGKETRP
jgi:pimeloyl-ACP methyl ester carboxylesterase